MSDTPDWADEEAGSLIFREDFDEGEPIIAAALRAAFLHGRIAGLRDAAEIADRTVGPSADIRAAADKLEKGEA